MRTWRLVILGREIVRTESSEDANQTLLEAINELIELPTTEEDEEDPQGDNYVSYGRMADEMEHMIFTSKDED